jgi:ribulose-phosphate 3-epimerase
MSVICPTVTAFDLHEYRSQLETAVSLSDRVHIDLMDGDMAPSVSPDISRLWIPTSAETDIHLMYKYPMNQLDKLIKLNPSMVIIQAEAEVHHMHFASELHKNNIQAGLCILQSTPVNQIEEIIHSFDHVLVFSGNLGYHGGKADLSLSKKVNEIKQIYPDVELGWDGGINDHNSKAIVEMGVDVLNVGGFIQKSKDPNKAYQTISNTLV